MLYIDVKIRRVHIATIIDVSVLTIRNLMVKGWQLHAFSP